MEIMDQHNCTTPFSRLSSLREIYTLANEDFIHDFYENLIATLPGHVYWMDCEGRVLGCNDQQAQSAGLKSRHEIVGKRNEDLPWNSKSKNLPKKLADINRQVIETGIAITVEEPGYYLDGRKATFLSRKAPIKSSSGKVIGLLGISIDITEKKEIEALKKKNDEASKIIQHMRVIAGAIAHEMRTPLATIRLSVQVATKLLSKLFTRQNITSNDLTVNEIEDTIAQCNDLLSTTIKGADQATSYINVMLGNLKSTTTHLKGKQEKLVASKFIIETVNEYPLLDQEKKAVNTQFIDDFEFYGDSSLCKNVINNLLKNAFYFIKSEGKGSINITTVQKGKYNEIVFTDTAKGASPEVLTNMFSEFYSKREQGTGLGLTFCKKVMNSMGGKILAESVENEYMRFRLLFRKLK